MYILDRLVNPVNYQEQSRFVFFLGGGSEEATRLNANNAINYIVSWAPGCRQIIQWTIAWEATQLDAADTNTIKFGPLSHSVVCRSYNELYHCKPPSFYYPQIVFCHPATEKIHIFPLLKIKLSSWHLKISSVHVGETRYHVVVSGQHSREKWFDLWRKAKIYAILKAL